MHTIIAIVISALCGTAHAAPAPTNLRPVAAQRLAAGHLPQWEGRAKVTTYCPRCSGGRCADGSPVRRGICAASPNIPMHSIVELEGIGKLKVCDRGGLVKVGTVTWRGKRVQCTQKGETANFDRWVPRCAGSCWAGPGTRRLVRYRVVGR